MNDRRIRLLLLMAALSFAPALAFYYVGEEAIFPIASLEMWHQREWIEQPLFGLMGEQTVTKLTQDRCVKAGVVQLKRQGILPVNAAAHRISGLLVR